MRPTVASLEIDAQGGGWSYRTFVVMATVMNTELTLRESLGLVGVSARYTDWLGLGKNWGPDLYHDCCNNKYSRTGSASSHTSSFALLSQGSTEQVGQSIIKRSYEDDHHHERLFPHPCLLLKSWDQVKCITLCLTVQTIEVRWFWLRYWSV